MSSAPAAVLVGTALGFLSGLGVGGGSLLVIWLTAVLGMEQHTAQGVNLLFFLPAALTASVFHWRQGRIQWQAVLPAVAAGVPAAILLAILAGQLESGTLRQLFGGLLILAGLSELAAGQRSGASLPQKSPKKEDCRKSADRLRYHRRKPDSASAESGGQEQER